MILYKRYTQGRTVSHMHMLEVLLVKIELGGGLVREIPCQLS